MLNLGAVFDFYPQFPVVYWDSVFVPTSEVIGHLVDSAANNHQRFVRAQQVAELVFPKYEQNDWVRVQGYNEVPWMDLVELWRRYNLHLAHVMRRIPDDKLEVRCTIGDYAPVTLGFLVEDYLTHLRHHLKKIGERVEGGETGRAG